MRLAKLQAEAANNPPISTESRSTVTSTETQGQQLKNSNAVCEDQERGRGERSVDLQGAEGMQMDTDDAANTQKTLSSKYVSRNQQKKMKKREKSVKRLVNKTGIKAKGKKLWF